MVPLERWFGYLLILVLYLAVPSSSQNETNAPTLFPQEGTNGTKIIPCNVGNVSVCLNTTDAKINSTNITLTEIQQDNLNNTNLNITETKSNETNTQNATDAKLTSEKADKSTKLNETNINNNQTETVLCLNTTVDANSTSSVNASNNATVETPPTSLNKTAGTNSTSGVDASKIDTEVPDLLKSGRVHPTVTELIPNLKFDQFTNPSKNRFNPSKIVDKETEPVEDGKITEDMLRDTSAKEGEAPLPGVPLVQGQLAAILAGVFITVSVIAYVGLLSWRRYLENRYGNRQMLINEDEFNDDLRHFSI